MDHASKFKVQLSRNIFFLAKDLRQEHRNAVISCVYLNQSIRCVTHLVPSESEAVTAWETI